LDDAEIEQRVDRKLETDSANAGHLETIGNIDYDAQKFPTAIGYRQSGCHRAEVVGHKSEL
jgi:hypothetical protein